MATPVTKRQREDSKPKVQSLLFKVPKAEGSNYLKWSIDARDYLRAEELDTALLKTPPTALTDAQKWKALLILRRHLDYSLRKQYIHYEDLSMINDKKLRELCQLPCQWGPVD